MKKFGTGVCIATLIICCIGTILAVIGAFLSILQNDWLWVLADILLIILNGLNIYLNYTMISDEFGGRRKNDE